MSIRGQNLREDICHVVARGDKDEPHDLVRNLLAKPSHFDAEMAVAATNHMIIDHGDARLVVLEQLGWGAKGKAKFREEITQPYHVFGGFRGGDVFSLSGAKED